MDEYKMDGITKGIVCVVISLIAMATYAIYAYHERTSLAFTSGYVQVQNVGTCGYHWEKLNDK